MKRFFSFFLSLVFISSICCISGYAVPVDSSSFVSSAQPLQINRSVLEELQGGRPAMTEEAAKTATQLIDQLTEIQRFITSPIVTHAQEVEHTTQMVQFYSIKNQLENLGVIPLTIEDIYALHGIDIASIAPSVPQDSLHITFYGVPTTILRNGTLYDVFSIFATSSGASTSDEDQEVPLYTADSIDIYNIDTYVSTDFDDILSMAVTVAGAFFEDAFEKVPILNYLPELWTAATYFNPSTKQRVTLDYDASQTFVFSYVAEHSIGYYTHVQTSERIHGTCALLFRQYLLNDTILETASFSYSAQSQYYSDYTHAVDLYINNPMQTNYQIGNIRIKLNNNVIETISMPYYVSLANLPGI